MNSTPSNQHAPIAAQSVFSRPAALIGGVIGLVALTAIATTLATRALAPSDTETRNGSSAPLAAISTPAADATPTAQPPATMTEKATAPAPSKPVHASATPAPHTTVKATHVQQGSVTPAEPSHPVAVACANCGKVESVSAVQQKGEATGLGVVGGAVVGGLVGSRVGGGSGKSLATVLGAVGGGVAGNEIEKRSRATTVYQVHVRMDDGSLRTLTQSTAPTVGQSVTVEGTTLRERSAAS
jgi:outer membrane lipoprotein SlyB